MRAMHKTYGSDKKAKEVFYATANKVKHEKKESAKHERKEK